MSKLQRLALQALAITTTILAAGSFTPGSICQAETITQSTSDKSKTIVQENDPFIWLEDVLGDKPLTWVKGQNAITTKLLEAQPTFEETKKRLLTILDSNDRIPSVTKHGQYFYNFWRDDKNARGLWRRTSMAEYKKAKPDWETVLDLDQLAAAEKENWVWEGADILYHDYDRALISLSRGGGDASVVREFDLTKKEFVASGFYLPEAKSDVTWRNRDTLYVGTDFGAGSMTTSGYPRIIKEWKRGTPLSQARTLFEGQSTDVGVSASVDHDHGQTYDLITEKPTFFSDNVFLRQDDKLVKIDKPSDAVLDTYDKNILLRLRSDWTVGGKSYKSGSLLAADFAAYLRGERTFSILFEPTDKKSLDSTSATKNYLLLVELDNVKSRPYILACKNGKWTREKLDAPAFGSISLAGIDADESDDYFLASQDFLTPASLYLGVAGTAERELIKSAPAFFKSDNLEIQQFEARSKDGTTVPYFQIGPKGLSKGCNNPTLLHAYGGFEISLLPAYDPLIGAAWLEKGGVYVVANIRGGGEFGPRWHEQARKENRQRAYDDFIAVAENLIERKVTSPPHLGIEGRSNGGLLMGVMLTQRPDLFGAIHCGSPLLDMRRYNHLLAGASWMGEYGDPDQADQWAYIGKYSPYQNLVKDKTYPPILITTATSDDRVHPGHARKMAARLNEEGHNFLYYENIEGGHGAAADHKQKAFMEALAYTFLWKELR